MILGIETSCDDTSVAVLSPTGEVLGLKSASQDASHRPFGGVVPEVASRQHTENILPLLEQVITECKVKWDQITGIAVTSRPGLIGSLLVGVVTAKTVSLVRGIPFIGVNHIEGHLLAPLLRDVSYRPPSGFTFPYLGLVVSGGHTHIFAVEKPGRYKLLGQTLDDAAGEAFDKFAKMMRFGFPGGVEVDRMATQGNREAFSFPRALLREDNLNFSFSGLKSSAARTLDTLSDDDRERLKMDLAASYQEAIVEVLLEKMRRAALQTGLKNWTITGGVSANSRLRACAMTLAEREGATLALAPLRYCTDNAAMIAVAGLYRLQMGEISNQELSPLAHSAPADWV